ncbi:hypothetical protein [Amycolatopsis pigmentata]|uniref:Uncharacterized protein n=1 Tax=Amycolatopsis pigmentata TaxID=450801 RepID=A0ABW5FWL6_9PSEU
MNVLLAVYLLLVAGLPVAFLILLIVRRRVLARRAAMAAPSGEPRVPVSQILARIAWERAAESTSTPRLRRPRGALARGRVWPDRDQDEDACQPVVRVPVQRRRYVSPEYRHAFPGR